MRVQIVLFGGFQDTGQRTTYLGDLWLFDTTEYKWHEVKQNELRKVSLPRAPLGADAHSQLASLRRGPASRCFLVRTGE